MAKTFVVTVHLKCYITLSVKGFEIGDIVTQIFDYATRNDFTFDVPLTCNMQIKQVIYHALLHVLCWQYGWFSVVCIICNPKSECLPASLLA